MLQYILDFNINITFKNNDDNDNEIILSCHNISKAEKMNDN